MNGVLPPKVFAAGALSALAFLALFPIIEYFSVFFSIFPLLSIVLTQPSSRSCQITILISLLIVFIASGLHNSITYLWFIAGPCLILSRQYFRHITIKKKETWYSANQLLTDFLVWNVMGVVILWLLKSQNDLQLDINYAFTQISQDPNYPKYQATFAKFKQIFNVLIYYNYGLKLALTSFITLYAFAKIQKIVVKNNINRRPPFIFIAVNLPKWWWWGLIISGCIWLTVGKASTFALLNANILIVILSGFFLCGLSIIHNLAKDHKNKQMILVLFYLCMILFTLLILLVTLLGILEPWLQVRQRFSVRKG